jgi:hypothetical protein
MRSPLVPEARPAFTLLEMILAAAVAVLLLAALYVAMDLQLRHAEAARDTVTETRLARTLLYRIAEDIAPDIGTADPTRYQQGGKSGSGGGASGGAGQSGGGMASGGSGGSQAGGQSSNQTNSGGSGGNSSNANTTTNADGSTSTFGSTSGTSATSSPNGLAVLALQGSANSLTLYVSRVPPDSDGQAPGVSDQRRIVYWLADGGGLCRQELPAVTSDDAMNGNVPSGTPEPSTKQLVAKEVQSLQFEYFDGSSWQESWDGTQVGPDGVTPIGPPLAVAITLGIAPPGGGEPKTYRHVVAIPTANSPTTMQNQTSSASSTGP